MVETNPKVDANLRADANSKPETGLTRVVKRNLFYFENYRQLSTVIFLLLFFIITLACFAIYETTTPPRPKYFPTSPDGRPIPMIPLNESLYTNDYILDWTKRAVVSIYSLDFVSFRQSLQEAQVYFTVQGHLDFMEAYRLSNNLEAIRERKQVVSAEIRGPGQVVQQGLDDRGIYYWALTLPITFTYENSESEVIRQMGVAQIVIQRDSLLLHPEGIAIRQLVFQGA